MRAQAQLQAAGFSTLSSIDAITEVDDGSSSGWPHWKIIVVAVCVGGGLLIISLCLLAFVCIKQTERAKRVAPETWAAQGGGVTGAQAPGAVTAVTAVTAHGQQQQQQLGGQRPVAEGLVPEEGPAACSGAASPARELAQQCEGPPVAAGGVCGAVAGAAAATAEPGVCPGYTQVRASAAVRVSEPGL